MGISIMADGVRSRDVFLIRFENFNIYFHFSIGPRIFPLRIMLHMSQ